MSDRKEPPPFPLAGVALSGAVMDYLNGATIRELAKKHNYSYTGMHDVLRRAGVVFRKKGGVKGKKVTLTRNALAAQQGKAARNSNGTFAKG